MFRVCQAFWTVHSSLVITCWEKANLFALLCVMFYCVFVTFLCDVLGQVRYLMVSISDLCLLTVIEYKSRDEVLQDQFVCIRLNHSLQKCVSFRPDLKAECIF